MFISENNQITSSPRLTFVPKTGFRLPKLGISYTICTLSENYVKATFWNKFLFANFTFENWRKSFCNSFEKGA